MTTWHQSANQHILGGDWHWLHEDDFTIAEIFPLIAEYYELK
jgi:hypothetical protein